MSNFIAVKVDAENNAELFWEGLRERFPNFAKSLERNGVAVIDNDLWFELVALPGFADGPEYAEAALIDCGGFGDQWSDCVGRRHEVFETLS